MDTIAKSMSDWIIGCLLKTSLRLILALIGQPVFCVMMSQYLKTRIDCTPDWLVEGFRPKRVSHEMVFAFQDEEICRLKLRIVEECHAGTSITQQQRMLREISDVAIVSGWERKAYMTDSSIQQQALVSRIV